MTGLERPVRHIALGFEGRRVREARSRKVGRWRRSCRGADRELIQECSAIDWMCHRVLPFRLHSPHGGLALPIKLLAETSTLLAVGTIPKWRQTGCGWDVPGRLTSLRVLIESTANHFDVRLAGVPAAIYVRTDATLKNRVTIEDLRRNGCCHTPAIGTHPVSRIRGRMRRIKLGCWDVHYGMFPPTKGRYRPSEP